MRRVSTSAVATTTAALAGLLAVAAFAPGPVLVLAVLLVAALVAVGWPDLLDLPARRGTTVVVLLAGAAAAVTAAWAVRTDRVLGGPDDGLLAQLPAVAALALLAAFVHQLVRRDGRPRLVESVSGAVTGQAVVVLGTAWIAVPATYAGAPLVAVVLAALTTTTAVCATGWPLRVAGPVSLLVGAATGWFASAVTILLGAEGIVSDTRWTVGGILAGVGAGLIASSWRALTVRLPAVGSLPAALAVAAVPVALAGGGAHVVGRIALLGG